MRGLQNNEIMPGSKSIVFNNRKISIIIIYVHIIFLLTLVLECVGFDVLILRQVLSFSYLTFMPGIAFLLALNIQKISKLEALLYIVGSSLTLLILIGLLINVVCPMLGISKPFSEIPLILGIIIFVFTSSALSLVMHNFSIKLSATLNFPFLSVILLLPLITIFGVYLLNFYNDNSLLLALLFVIGFFPLVIEKFPKKLFPAVIFSIALSLIWHIFLSTEYLYGPDAHTEFYFANLVKINSFWDESLSISTNGLPSITILVPIYSIVCKMSVTQVFNLVIPSLFALVPVGLFQLYNTVTFEQQGYKLAFLASFFYLSHHSFFMDDPNKIRQATSIFFLTLVMLTLFNCFKNNKDWKKKLLLILFSFSLALSHYGTSYFFMFILIVASILIFIFKQKLDIHSYLFYYISIIMSWYIYTINSCNFRKIIMIGNHIIKNLFIPEQSPAHWAATAELGPYWQVIRIFYIMSIIFIIIGILECLHHKLRKKEARYMDEFLFFSTSTIFILSAVSLAGHFGGKGGSIGFHITRLYSIALIFLAPFCVTGIYFLIKHLKMIIPSNTFSKLPVISFFVVFFFVDSFFIAGIMHQPTVSPISKPYIKGEIDNMDELRFYSRYTQEYNVLSAKFLSKNKYYKIYLFNSNDKLPLISYGMIIYNSHFFEMLSEPNWHKLSSEGKKYVYLGYLSYKKGIIFDEKIKQNYLELRKRYSELSPYLNQMNKIYDNEGSAVYEK